MSNSTPTRDEFLKRVSKHEITVLKDDGLYRHLRFRKPGTGIDGFDIVTWPGYLCYCGDMGEYVFSRIDDMFGFFRWGISSEGIKINPSYWSEKVLAADRDGVDKYDPDKFRQRIKEYLDEAEDVTEEVRQEVEDFVLSCADDGEYAAYTAVCDFESDGFRFQDFFECNLRSYTYRFIFCCYAVVWGISKYDELNKGDDK